LLKNRHVSPSALLSRALLKAGVLLLFSCPALMIPNASASFFGSSSAETEKPFSATLSGFAPKAVVSYRFSSGTAAPLSGTGTTDAKGDLHIPLPLTAPVTPDPAQAPPALTYEFTITEEGGNRPLHVALKLDPATGHFSVTGKGASAFETLHIDAASQHIRTRSDWAGLFDETVQTPDSSKDSTENGIYKVAFYNPSHIENDAILGETSDIKQDATLNENAYTFLPQDKIDTLKKINSIMSKLEDPDSTITEDQRRVLEDKLKPLLESLNMSEEGKLGTLQNIREMMDQLKNAGATMTAELKRELEKQIRMMFQSLNMSEEEMQQFFDGTEEPPATIELVSVGKTEELQKNMKGNMIDPLMSMGENLSAVALQGSAMVGTLFDAKDQMEAQRTIQQHKAETVKDYHPSDQMCRFGTFTRSLATTESKARFDQLALSNILMGVYTNKSGNSSATSKSGSAADRLKQYKTTYCDPADNNGGLGDLCKNDGKSGKVGASDKKRVNMDIDFVRTLQTPYTLDVDFSDGKMSKDEEDVIALAKNIYWPDQMKVVPEADLAKDKYHYLQARRIIAMENMAHNSFVKLVSLKAKSPAPQGSGTTGGMHMKTMMREFGMKDDEIEKFLGENPSYYAQMDVLTKKIYQNPDFYTNLYDKPANVERIKASMNALGLIQMRDQYEASLRREMLTSGLVEETIIPKTQETQGAANDAKLP